MTRGRSNSSIRKALGSIKDTTTISLAKVSSEYKELDIAIVKATNHVERPAKERHIRAIFAAVSAARPRADVAYCIHTLSKRLVKTHNWAVALKSLIVIHRALREVDPSFHEELINYGRRGGHVLNMSHFKDDSSAYAWDFSAWIRCYALYLEERLECFRVLKYDVETDQPKTRDLDTVDLLQHLPYLQQLLSRAIACQLEGTAANNTVIQLALSLVASESMKIHNAISDATFNLVDKFFEMQRDDAIKALDIYRRVGQQAERLSLFQEVCMSLNIRGERFIRIEQPPANLLQAMEDYVRVAPKGPTSRNEQRDTPKDILTIEDKKDAESKQNHPMSHPHAEPIKEEKNLAKPLDLLSLDDPAPAQELDEKNASALAIVLADNESTTKAPPPRLENGITGWELSLVTTPSSNEPTTMPNKLAGGLDKFTLDSLYDEAIQKTNQPTSYNPWEPTPMANRMAQQPPPHDPFFTSRAMAAPSSVQMAAMTAHHQAFKFQQQQQQQLQQQQHLMMMGQYQPTMNPYGASRYAPGMPVHQGYNPYAGML